MVLEQKKEAAKTTLMQGLSLKAYHDLEQLAKMMYFFGVESWVQYQASAQFEVLTVRYCKPLLGIRLDSEVALHDIVRSRHRSVMLQLVQGEP